MTKQLELNVITYEISEFKFAIDYNEVITVLSADNIVQYSASSIIFKNEKIPFVMFSETNKNKNTT